MDLFLSLKYGAIPYNGLGFTAIWKFEICTQFEQKMWFIQNVYHIYFLSQLSPEAVTHPITFLPFLPFLFFHFQFTFVTI